MSTLCEVSFQLIFEFPDFSLDAPLDTGDLLCYFCAIFSYIFESKVAHELYNSDKHIQAEEQQNAGHQEARNEGTCGVEGATGAVEVRGDSFEVGV